LSRCCYQFPNVHTCFALSYIYCSQATGVSGCPTVSHVPLRLMTWTSILLSHGWSRKLPQTLMTENNTHLLPYGAKMELEVRKRTHQVDKCQLGHRPYWSLWRQIHSQIHAGCRQNAFPCGYRLRFFFPHKFLPRSHSQLLEFA
jgi:hypothetical protein